MKKFLLKMNEKTIAVCENPIEIPPTGIKSKGFDEDIKQNKFDAKILETIFERIRTANENGLLKDVTLMKETPKVNTGEGWLERDLNRPEELTFGFKVLSYS